MKKKHKTTHEKNLTRLARIEGQVRGIQRMIERGEYCIDIITQIHAVQSALSSVARKVMEKHLDMCVTEALQGKSKPEINQKIEELMIVMKRMCK